MLTSVFHHLSPCHLALHNMSYHKWVSKWFTHPHSSFVRGATFRNSLTSLMTSSLFLWHTDVHSSGGECSLSFCTTLHVSGSVRLLEQHNGAVESQIYGDSILVKLCKLSTAYARGQWRTEGGVWGVQTTPPKIPKALQNRAKLNPIVKTVKNCWI